MVRDPLPVVLWSEIDRMVGAEGVIGERPIAWVDKASRLSTLWLGVYVMLFLTMLINGLLWLLGYLASDVASERLNGGGGLVLAATLVVSNLLIHEAGHVLALRWCGRRPDKVGFKMNYWVMPAFFVRINQVSLLPRRERLLCHSAGLFANLIAVNLVVLCQEVLGLGEEGRYGTALVMIFVATNLLPLWNADGQRTLLACFDLEEVEGWSDAPKPILVLRIVSLGVLAYIIIFVVVSFLWR